jgi:hypothetical protein
MPLGSLIALTRSCYQKSAQHPQKDNRISRFLGFVVGLFFRYLLLMPKNPQPETCKVKILGRLWTLVKKQPPHPSYDGLCCFEDRKIFLGPSGLRTRRLELLSHELLHARFRELDEESILDAGRLIHRIHKKVRNYGYRMCHSSGASLTPAKAAKANLRKKRQKPSKQALKKR